MAGGGVSGGGRGGVGVERPWGGRGGGEGMKSGGGEGFESFSKSWPFFLS